MKCTVRKGQRYRARIEIPFFKRAFANELVIRARLTEAGFADVAVKGEGSGVYWAWGTWLLADATEDVDYVEQFDAM